jgi:DNA-binding IclR family transcriptional regulator
LRILETLAGEPQGMPLAAIAGELELPRSATHRLLAELVRCGHVRQVRDHGDYALTTKLPALGLIFLGGAGIVDIAQPIITGWPRFPASWCAWPSWTGSADLRRQGPGCPLGPALRPGHGDRRAAVVQRRRARVAHDPRPGTRHRAGGGAGFRRPEELRPKAPTTFKALMKFLDEDRKRGFSMISESTRRA